MNAEKLRQYRLLLVAVAGVVLSGIETYGKLKNLKAEREYRAALLKEQVNIQSKLNNLNVNTSTFNTMFNPVAYKEAIKRIRYNKLKEFSEEGYNTLTYSKAKWNEVKSRFSLLKNTYEEDGLYYAAFNDKKYYIAVGLEEN